ncbi:subtilisin-like protease SBT4.3 [Helianthus annuus]|uniref:subtilisin-like protease SBT4.3 n=1 Tax=Helianthus annuus TaxID=4232 RepID=UPI000B8F2D8F|nr:subtilisin-like protease SBT4.3 [Helianthus annuus]
MKASVLFLQNGKEYVMVVKVLSVTGKFVQDLITWKIIGARTFSLQSYNKFSARDTSGHGTHVASIISGREVIDASYYGIAKGIARGGVPSTRIAAYKVCYHINCFDIDVLSAFDHAIADGVDIISVSIARPRLVELTFDPIAIGAFHAMEKGILTTLTVATSDTDRRIVDKLVLANYEEHVGNAINPFFSSVKPVPLVYGKELPSSCSEIEKRKCLPECLVSSFINQKVIVCDQDRSLREIKASGAFGCIVPISFQNNYSEIMSFPTIALPTESLDFVKLYKKYAKVPEVQILRSETIKNPGAPYVASFSARGPKEQKMKQH